MGLHQKNSQTKLLLKYLNFFFKIQDPRVDSSAAIIEAKEKGLKKY